MLDYRDSILGRSKTFSLLYATKTGSGDHPVSYPKGTTGNIFGCKEAGA
jgi:hypothetical protein